MATVFTEDFQNQLSHLPDIFVQQKYWICKNVFKPDKLNELKFAFNNKKQLLRPAKIGKGLGESVKKSIRSDSMLWLKDKDPEFSAMWMLLDTFSLIARRDLYLPIKRYEAQVALYKEGEFYERHVDRHKLLPSRLLTMVFYFNEWEPKDSGELALYAADRKIIIEPIVNQVILFASELEHEVLQTNKERRSLTAWLRDDVL